MPVVLYFQNSANEVGTWYGGLGVWIILQDILELLLS